jgi:uncharacterized protein with GYD domain
MVCDAVEAAGGKLEAFYFARGDKDWILFADMPDPASAAAFSLAASKSGLLRTTTTPLEHFPANRISVCVAKKAIKQEWRALSNST